MEKAKEKSLEKEVPSIEKLKEKLTECEKIKTDYLAGWQRARADFLNYKKEETERIEEFLKYGKEEFILKILPILDSFDRASRQNFLPKNFGGREKEKITRVIDGFLKIKEQLEDFLKNEEVKEIEAIGKKFDPNFHEAVEEVTASKEPGTIIEEIQKGYTLHGKVIRPAKVKVAR